MSIIRNSIGNILKLDPLTLGILVIITLFLSGILSKKGLIYGLWMKFVRGLAFINTRIILSLFFYIVATSYGLVLKIIGKDLLNIKKSKAKTYWQKRESNRKKEDYLKQF